jgi:hypothetical protein
MFRWVGIILELVLTVTGPGFEYIGSELNTDTAPVASAGQYMSRCWSLSHLEY